MLVGEAFLPPSFPPSKTWAFYIIKRQNCVNICNTVYVLNQLKNHSYYQGLYVKGMIFPF